jgi:hypothetical protein
MDDEKKAFHLSKHEEVQPVPDMVIVLVKLEKPTVLEDAANVILAATD